jgi:hypothetical protein
VESWIASNGLRFALHLKSETLDESAHLNALYKRLKFEKGVSGVFLECITDSAKLPGQICYHLMIDTN